MNENIELMHILGRLHSYISQRYLDNRLPMPVITLSGEGRSRKGFYHPARWREARVGTGRGANVRVITPPDARDEIVIHAEIGLTDSFAEIAATFVHQMMHQAQEHFPEIYGEPSKSIDSASHYHNKAWHDFMRQRLGLQTEGPKGYTTVTPRFEDLMSGFEAPTHWLMRAPSDSKAPTRLKLWMCKCTRVRCAVPLDATCNRCATKFSKCD